MTVQVRIIIKANLFSKEIIEFPVVIVDVENRKIIEDKFHYYIKPVVYPKLLPFCIELTGIKQEQVDNGILLQDALENLDQFLKEKVNIFTPLFIKQKGNP